MKQAYKSVHAAKGAILNLFHTTPTSSIPKGHLEWVVKAS